MPWDQGAEHTARYVVGSEDANQLPILVFDLMTPGNVRSILAGQAIGTLVS